MCVLNRGEIHEAPPRVFNLSDSSLFPPPFFHHLPVLFELQGLNLTRDSVIQSTNPSLILQSHSFKQPSHWWGLYHLHFHLRWIHRRERINFNVYIWYLTPTDTVSFTRRVLSLSLWLWHFTRAVFKDLFRLDADNVGCYDGNATIWIFTQICLKC